MKTLNYVHPESPVKMEVTILEEGDRKGWALKEDGSPRYFSSGAGMVVVEESAGGWYWNEYDHPDHLTNGKKASEILARIKNGAWVEVLD